MTENFDLLGDPIPEGHGKRGRPTHIATVKNRNKVMMLLALGWSNSRIANALGITPPTLRKNYFRELKIREQARDRLDGNLAAMLWESAKGGNVAAMKEYRKLVERNDQMNAAANFGAIPEKPKGESKQPVGKKEQAEQAALVAGEDTEWGNDLRIPGILN